MSFGIILLTYSRSVRRLQLLQVFVDHGPQFLRDLEERNEMLVDPDLRSRTGIASHPPFPLLGLEAAESAYFDILSFFQSLDHGLNEAVDHRLRFNLCQAGP